MKYIADKAALLAVINKYNTRFRPLVMADITWGLPTAIIVEGNRNTQLVLTMNGRTRTIKYNRVPLSQIFFGFNDLTIQTDPSDTHALLPLIEAQYNVRLSTDDIVLTPILVDAPSVTLTAKPDSIGWIQGVTITLTKAAVEPNRTVFTLDDGSVFMLDNDFILLTDDDVEI